MHVRERFQRSLPFADYIVDRREKAREFGWRCGSRVQYLGRPFQRVGRIRRARDWRALLQQRGISNIDP